MNRPPSGGWPDLGRRRGGWYNPPSDGVPRTLSSWPGGAANTCRATFLLLPCPGCFFGCPPPVPLPGLRSRLPFIRSPRSVLHRLLSRPLTAKRQGPPRIFLDVNSLIVVFPEPLHRKNYGPGVGVIQAAQLLGGCFH